MKSAQKATLLQTIHTALAFCFIACLFELYYAAITRREWILFWISFMCLAIEGFVVFILNNGNCPPIYIQRKVGDEKQFFELFLLSRIVKKAIPFFTALNVGALVLLLIRLG